MTDKPVFDEIESVLIGAMPIASIVNEVMQATQQKQQHPLGVYKKHKPSVISVGAEPTMELIGVQIPINQAIYLAGAYEAMKDTKYGQQYIAKVKKAAKTMAQPKN